LFLLIVRKKERKKKKDRKKKKEIKERKRKKERKEVPPNVGKIIRQFTICA